MIDYSPDELVNCGLRLVQATSMPGFRDVENIIEELCQQAMDALVHFDGWDPQAVQCLQQRAKSAYEMRDAIYSMIKQRIMVGEQQQLAMSAAQHFSEPEPQKAVDSDGLREKALKLYDQTHPVREEADGRIPGTYTTLPDGRRI